MKNNHKKKNNDITINMKESKMCKLSVYKRR